jgi:predicted RNA-binding Zn-ribbon protein involved in translation (DUF1610 family)
VLDSKFLKITCFCSYCDKPLAYDEVLDGAEGEPLCGLCYDYIYTRCQACGETILVEEAELGLCPSCWKEEFFQCAGCGEAYEHDKEWRITEVVNGQEHLSTYCAACVAEQGWFKCAGCGKQYFVHDLHGSHKGQLYCRGCYEKLKIPA